MGQAGTSDVKKIPIAHTIRKQKQLVEAFIHEPKVFVIGVTAHLVLKRTHHGDKPDHSLLKQLSY